MPLANEVSHSSIPLLQSLPCQISVINGSLIYSFTLFNICQLWREDGGIKHKEKEIMDMGGQRVMIAGEKGTVEVEEGIRGINGNGKSTIHFFKKTSFTQS